MGWRLPLLLILVTALLTAGCVNPASSPVEEASTPEDVEPSTEASRATWFLTGNMGLTTEAPTSPESARVATGNFYSRWATGAEQPTWRGSSAAGDLLLTGNASLTFWAETEHAVPTTGPRDEGFPEYVAYFGVEGSPTAYASISGPDVMLPGEAVRFDVELTLPPGGLVLEEGAHPVVIVAPVQGQDDRATRLDILVNGTEHPSRVEVAAEPVDLGEPRWHLDEAHEGVLAGSAYAAETSATKHEVPVAVNGSTTRLSVSLTSEGVGVRDIDVALRNPDGDLVARGATPHPEEGIVLHAPALAAGGPGSWTVEVVNYGHAAVAYDLEVGLAGR